MVVAPCLTTTRSTMYFASSVAVAVAPGTPGTGKVTTGLPVSHDTDVSPVFATPSWSSVPGLGPSSVVGAAPASAALGAPWGLAHRRMSRSCTVPGIGVAFPFPEMISAPAMSSFQAYWPLTTSMPEYICPLGREHVY